MVARQVQEDYLQSERTDGVPLFVEELTRSIIESGTDPSENIVIPNSVQDSLMARLDRLSAPIASRHQSSRGRRWLSGVNWMTFGGLPASKKRPRMLQPWNATVQTFCSVRTRSVQYRGMVRIATKK